MLRRWIETGAGMRVVEVAAGALGAVALLFALSTALHLYDLTGAPPLGQRPGVEPRRPANAYEDIVGALTVALANGASWKEPPPLRAQVMALVPRSSLPRCGWSAVLGGDADLGPSAAHYGVYEYVCGSRLLHSHYLVTPTQGAPQAPLRGHVGTEAMAEDEFHLPSASAVQALATALGELLPLHERSGGDAEGSVRWCNAESCGVTRQQGADDDTTTDTSPGWLFFIHGNAGAANQVSQLAQRLKERHFRRSLLRLAEAAVGAVQPRRTHHKTFTAPPVPSIFTLHFREEANIHRGKLLLHQAAYVARSLIHMQRRWMQLNSHENRTCTTLKAPRVWLLGHSMGGIVARMAALMLRASMDGAASVSCDRHDCAPGPTAVGVRVEGIITLNTPHRFPPLFLDRWMTGVYRVLLAGRFPRRTHEPRRESGDGDTHCTGLQADHWLGEAEAWLVRATRQTSLHLLLSAPLRSDGVLGETISAAGSQLDVTEHLVTVVSSGKPDAARRHERVISYNSGWRDLQVLDKLARTLGRPSPGFRSRCTCHRELCGSSLGHNDVLLDDCLLTHLEEEIPSLMGSSLGHDASGEMLAEDGVGPVDQVCSSLFPNYTLPRRIATLPGWQSREWYTWPMASASLILTHFLYVIMMAAMGTARRGDEGEWQPAPLAKIFKDCHSTVAVSIVDEKNLQAVRSDPARTFPGTFVWRQLGGILQRVRSRLAGVVRWLLAVATGTSSWLRPLLHSESRPHCVAHDLPVHLGMLLVSSVALSLAGVALTYGACQRNVPAWFAVGLTYSFLGAYQATGDAADGVCAAPWIQFYLPPSSPEDGRSSWRLGLLLSAALGPVALGCAAAVALLWFFQLLRGCTLSLLVVRLASQKSKPMEGAVRRGAGCDAAADVRIAQHVYAVVVFLVYAVARPALSVRSAVWLVLTLLAESLPVGEPQCLLPQGLAPRKRMAGTATTFAAVFLLLVQPFFAIRNEVVSGTVDSELLTCDPLWLPLEGMVHVVLVRALSLELIPIYFGRGRPGILPGRRWTFSMLNFPMLTIAAVVFLGVWNGTLSSACAAVLGSSCSVHVLLPVFLGVALSLGAFGQRLRLPFQWAACRSGDEANGGSRDITSRARHGQAIDGTKGLSWMLQEPPPHVVARLCNHVTFSRHLKVARAGYLLWLGREVMVSLAGNPVEALGSATPLLLAALPAVLFGMPYAASPWQ